MSIKVGILATCKVLSTQQKSITKVKTIDNNKTMGLIKLRFLIKLKDSYVFPNHINTFFVYLIILHMSPLLYKIYKIRVNTCQRLPTHW